MIARRIIVHGRVQGVSYRAWTVEKARRLGLRGWVRNLRSGAVELLAIGDGKAIDALVAALHEGPPAARVEGVEVTEAGLEEADGFTQRLTA